MRKPSGVTPGRLFSEILGPLADSKQATAPEDGLNGVDEMPNWVGPLLALVVLAGFMGFAFRQGTKVKPDKDNPDNWQSGGGEQSPGEGSHHGGFDGHSSS
jgi:hypothetical protein